MLGESALSALQERGPDGQSFEVHRNAFFGHTRLSIIDLSEKATQPLKSIESGNLITVNGEIYDYKKIRRELGIEKFYSDSDSEVLLIAYDQKGLQGALEGIDGMYAAAILDVRSIGSSLRDRVGIKPLYYGWIDGCCLG